MPGRQTGDAFQQVLASLLGDEVIQLRLEAARLRDEVTRLTAELARRTPRASPGATGGGQAAPRVGRGNDAVAGRVARAKGLS
jgi:hypothetical protein